MADQTLRAQAVRHLRARRLLVVSAIVLLLFGVPWWTLLFAGTRWPTPVLVIGTLALAAAMVALPMTMMWGHGRRHRDGAAVTGDVLLGAVWVLFVWSVLSQVLRLALLVFGVGDPARSRIVAATVVVVVVALLVWGHFSISRYALFAATWHGCPKLRPRGVTAIKLVVSHERGTSNFAIEVAGRRPLG